MKPPTRRQILFGALAAPPAAYVYATRVEPHWLKIPRLPLELPGLPPVWRGRTVAHLSDLHIGPEVSEDYLRRSFRRLAGLRPDVVLYTGDFISYERRLPNERLARLLEHAPRGRVATFGVPGNHDYGAGWREDAVADDVARIAADAGIPLLRNRSARVEGLLFCGVDDLWAGHADPQAAFADATPGDVPLILNHNPDAVDLPEWEGRRGVVLAGHTHGGQCKPPFLPPPLLPVKNPRYSRGRVRVRAGLDMHISAGIGHLMRVRFNTRPEAPIFTLA